MNRQAGFTLIEMLIVLTIVGIMITVGLTNYLRFARLTQVREAAQQFARDVDVARNEAKRTNDCWTISYSPGGATTYRLQQYATSNCSGDVVATRQATLPNGAVLTPNDGSSVMQFVPPFGTTGDTAVTFTVGLVSDSTYNRTVRVSGVMGRVVIR